VGIAAGNYTLQAEATSVSGETNTGNNLFVNGQIQILPAHNVAITAITFSRFTFPPNYLTTMNLTIQNKGTFSETFNVSAYVEATQLGNHSLSLNSGEFVELTFDWDSSGMPYGNYTAYAIVETAVNETSLEDNYIETQITIVWPYDVTGDNYVGIDDIVAIAERFGTTHPTYDVNGDDYVGIDDIVETAEHFGESI
jgi:hypothetical protein